MISGAFGGEEGLVQCKMIYLKRRKRLIVEVGDVINDAFGGSGVGALDFADCDMRQETAGLGKFDGIKGITKGFLQRN